MLMLLATNTDLGGAQERRELDGLLSGVAAGDREAFEAAKADGLRNYHG